MSIKKEVFIKVIQKKIDENKEEYIDLISGDIHREIGVYPKKGHRMATCCIAMMELMSDNDEVLDAPPSGKGATLKIRYYKR